MKPATKKATKQKILIKKCHLCGHINEAVQEIERCGECKKAFLPLNYFLKIHEKTDQESFRSLFACTDQIDEEDLIQGIYVLW